MLNVGVVGGTGYTGVELLRLLAQHSEVRLQLVTSRSEAGQKVSDVYPNLRGHVDVVFSEPDVSRLKECDVVFFATPNGIAMQSAEELLQANVKVIDISADFRFQNLEVWSHWYGMEHACPDVVPKAVYGLPELNREELKKAQIIACSGCYTTAAQLALLPALESSWSNEKNIIVDAKSGISGAGRGAAINSLYSERSENFNAYGLTGHRHQPEIVESLSRKTNKELSLFFVPHLVPMVRGILASAYIELTESKSLEEIQSVYEQRYQDEHFVDVMPLGSCPDTKGVRASNTCRIAISAPYARGAKIDAGDRVLVIAVIDNLVKGASGQAVQNMNIACGFDEALGLDAIALAP